MDLPKKKDEMVAELHRRIDEASQRIDELRVQAKLGQTEFKQRVHDRVTALEERREKLRSDLRQLSETGEGAWEQLSEGCKRSWQEFRQAVENAVAEFKKPPTGDA